MAAVALIIPGRHSAYNPRERIARSPAHRVFRKGETPVSFAEVLIKARGKPGQVCGDALIRRYPPASNQDRSQMDTEFCNRYRERMPPFREMLAAKNAKVD